MQAIEAEAARLYLKARASDAPKDWNDAYAWVAQDPAHGFAFAKAEAGWELAERLNELPAGQKDGVAAAAVAPPDNPVPAEAIVAASRHRVGRRRLFVSFAAAAAIGVASTVALRLLGTVDHYRTALGETRTVRLADGSKIHLNTNSSVEVALHDDVRSISLLKGEAQFDVAHDKKRPFIVNADGTLVRAVGTMFNVRLRADVTELTVIEGIVAVRNGDSAVRRIESGRSAAVRSGSIAVTHLEPAKIRQRTAWQAGMVEFEGDTLAQAVEEFNRYRPTPLVIGDPAIASLRVGGAFRLDRSQDFVDALESGFGIRAVPGSDNSIILVSAEGS
ncbi:FecR family protein [Sphingobium yanoikuyae]|uniref:FecR family protein n=1 Tax=Sphingobium yanoikuyae TaxID=13690 RepID=UPI00293E5D64|nr:FecR domain-containing protein [Sphingobium yanoikuyae]